MRADKDIERIALRYKNGNKHGRSAIEKHNQIKSSRDGLQGTAAIPSANSPNPPPTISSWTSASAAFDLPGIGMAISTDTCKPSISSSGVLSASSAFLLFRERKESHEGGGSGVTKGDVDQAFGEARGESPGGCGLVPRRIAGLYVGVAVMRAIPRPPTATKFGKYS